MPAGVAPRTAVAPVQGRARAGHAPLPAKPPPPQPGATAARKRSAATRSPRKDRLPASGRSDAIVAATSSVSDLSRSSPPLLLPPAAEWREPPLPSPGQSVLSDPSASMPSSDFTQVTALPTGEGTLLALGSLSFLQPCVFPRPDQKGAKSGQQAAVCEVNVCAPAAKKRLLERRGLSAALGAEDDVLTLYLLDSSCSMDGSRYRAREGGTTYSKSPRRHSPRTKQPKVRSLKRQKAQTSLTSHSGHHRSQHQGQHQSQHQGQAAVRHSRRRPSSPRVAARRRARSPRLPRPRTRHLYSRGSGSSLEVSSFSTEGSHSTVIVSSPGKSISSSAWTRSSSSRSTKSCQPLQDLTSQLGNRISLSDRQKEPHGTEESSKSTVLKSKLRRSPSKARRGTTAESWLQSRPDTSAAADSVILRGSMKSRNRQLLSAPRMRTSTPVGQSDDEKRSFIPSSSDTVSSVNTDRSLMPRGRGLQTGAGTVGRVPETSDSLSLQSGVVTSSSDERVTRISETMDTSSSEGKMDQVLDVISRIPRDATRCEKNEAFLLSPNIVPPKTSTPIEREKRAGPLISTPKTPSPKAKKKPVIPEVRPRPEGCSFSSSPRASSPPGDSEPSKDSVDMVEDSFQSGAFGSQRAAGSGESRGETIVGNQMKLSVARSSRAVSTAFSAKVLCKLSVARSTMCRNFKPDQHQSSSGSASMEFDPNSQPRPDISGCSQPSRDSSLSRTATVNSGPGQETFVVTSQQRHSLPRTPTKVRASPRKASPPKSMRESGDVRREALFTSQSSSPAPRSPLVQGWPALSTGEESDQEASMQVSIHTASMQVSIHTASMQVSIHSAGSGSLTDDSTSSWSALCTPATARKLFTADNNLDVPLHPPPDEGCKKNFGSTFQDPSEAPPEYSHRSDKMEVESLRPRSVSPRNQTLSKPRSPMTSCKGSPLISPRRRLFGETENTFPECSSPKSPVQTDAFKDEIERRKKNCRVRRSWLNFPPPAVTTLTENEVDQPGLEKSPLPSRARPAQSPRSMKRRQASPPTSPTGSDRVPEKRRKRDYTRVSPFGGQASVYLTPQKTADTSPAVETWTRRLSSPMPALRSPLLPQSFSERLTSPFKRNSMSALDKVQTEVVRLRYVAGSPFSRNQSRQSPIVPMVAPRCKDPLPPEANVRDDSPSCLVKDSWNMGT